MTPVGVDEERVIQVVARGAALGQTPWVGSGYLAGGSLALTAAHAVNRADTVTVRRVLGLGRVAEAKASIAWIDPDPRIDLAVLRFVPRAEEAALFPANLAPLRFGRVDGPVECEAVGFPLFKLREGGSGRFAAAPAVYRDSHHAIGTTTPLSNLREGTLEITVPPPADDDPHRSPWQGMSGAAVFSNGVLIGLVCEHHRSEGPNRITARRVKDWYDLAPEALAELRNLLRLPSVDLLEHVGTPVQAGIRTGQIRDISTFTGREKDLALLVGALDEESGGGTLAIHAVDGMPGVGKTAFAVHAAHRLAARFPDGQFHLRLHAHTPGITAVAATAALASLLLGDGLPPAELPDDADARAHLWRSRTAQRRMLLLLDDAADAEQVRPLLPAAPGTLVLITSRHRLAGLEDVQPMNLAVLPQDDAIELFLRIASRPDLTADNSEIAALVELCGYLPLAIGMLASRLKNRPRQTPGDVIDQFRGAKNRLDELRDRDHTMAAVFDLSYRDLTREQQRLFHLLGARPGTETDPPAAAELLGTDVTTARHLLEDLQDFHLIDELTAVSGRYRMHDLIREYAAGLTDISPSETESGIERLLTYYQQTGAPDSTLSAPDQERVLAWLRIERENLLACRQHAINHEKDGFVVGLSAALGTVLRMDGSWSEYQLISEHAAGIAQRLGDRHGQADALIALGMGCWLVDDYQKAAEVLERALGLFRELGDRQGQARAFYELGTVRNETGNHSEAAEVLERALGLFRELGDRRGEALAVYRLGAVRYHTGDFPGAIEALQQSLEAFREFRNRLGEASARYMLGAVLDITGQYAQAAEAHQQALGLYQELGNRLGQANALNDLGIVRNHSGDYSAATEAFEHALNLYRELGDRRGQASALGEMGEMLLQTGDLQRAAEAIEQALQIDREIGHQRGEVSALNNYARIMLATGDLTQARTQYAKALELARTLGSKAYEAIALEGFGELLLQEGDTENAKKHLSEALKLYQQLGMPEANQVAARLAELGLENNDSSN